MEILQIPALTDNYIYVLISDDIVAVVDPCESEPVTEALFNRGLGLDFILSTHHHWDHVGGNIALKDRWGAQIIGAANDSARIPGIDLRFRDGDEFVLGASTMRVMEVPGHTIGQVAYFFPNEKKLFCGDTLFAMGCGRLFEGTPQQMTASLKKIAALPPDTEIYCGHEYTKRNAEFALTVDRENKLLKDRYERVSQIRIELKFTVPFTLAEELQTNPFLRLGDETIQKNIGCSGAPPHEVFAKLRSLKDTF